MNARCTVVARLRAAVAALLVLGLLVIGGNAKAGSYATLVMDAANGGVLYGVSSDEPRYPASLTKMMTLYVTFEAIDAGRIRLSDRMRVSYHAASQSPSKLGLHPGDEITVENAILALVTKSANDAAAVLAEHLGGSESAFAERMTARAQAIGMTSSTFRNASGLPDSGQVTTARDMATLAHALLHRFPHYYSYFSTPSFYYGGVAHRNHNRLLGTYAGVDGIKTGFINASGFNLVASAKRDGRRLIGVVFGARSLAERARIMTALLDGGFQALDTGTFVETAPLRATTAVASAAASPQTKKRRPSSGSQLVGKAKVKTVALAPAMKSKKGGKATKGPAIVAARTVKNSGKSPSGKILVIGGSKPSAVMKAPATASAKPKPVIKASPSTKGKAQPAAATTAAKRKPGGKSADKQEALKACQKSGAKSLSCRNVRSPSGAG